MALQLSSTALAQPPQQLYQQLYENPESQNDPSAPQHRSTALAVFYTLRALQHSISSLLNAASTARSEQNEGI